MDPRSDFAWKGPGLPEALACRPLRRTTSRRRAPTREPRVSSLNSVPATVHITIHASALSNWMNGTQGTVQGMCEDVVSSNPCFRSPAVLILACKLLEVAESARVFAGPEGRECAREKELPFHEYLEYSTLAVVLTPGHCALATVRCAFGVRPVFPLPNVMFPQRSAHSTRSGAPSVLPHCRAHFGFTWGVVLGAKCAPGTALGCVASCSAWTVKCVESMME